MLVNLADVLFDAKKKKYAVGAFNVPNLESIRAVIAAAEELNVPRAGGTRASGTVKATSNIDLTLEAGSKVRVKNENA